jgi:glycosyltransferase involved in cell wall biosynthesis
MSHDRVLFIATVYTHLAAFHIPFMRFLQDKGYEVHAAASPTEGRKEEVEAIGVTCWDVPFARSPYNPRNIRAFSRLKNLLRNHHYDLIHVHTPVAAFLGRYLAKMTHGNQVLYTAHGFHFYDGAPRPNWLIYYTAERIAANWTDGLIVMNSEDYQNAKRMGFRPGHNLFYVHGVGVNVKEFYSQDTMGRSFRNELGIRPDDVVITCVAELNENKNHTFLLDGWSRLTQHNDQIHLLLVGTGDQVGPLKEKVRQQRLPRVHFLGYRTDVPRILSNTDIATLVSKREGLPRSIMEGMAAGKPTVASDIRGNCDLIEDGCTGFLVELGDVDGLVAAFERLISDQDMRDRMGAAGRARIEVYDLDNVLVEMAKVYDCYLSR